MKFFYKLYIRKFKGVESLKVIKFLKIFLSFWNKYLKISFTFKYLIFVFL